MNIIQRVRIIIEKRDQTSKVYISWSAARKVHIPKDQRLCLNSNTTKQVISDRETHGTRSTVFGEERLSWGR